MGVASFQVEGQCTLRAVQGRGEICTARIADEDVLEVRELAGLEGMYQAKPGGRIGYAEGVVLQGFAPVAAEVGESLLIAIVRQLANVDLFGIGCAYRGTAKRRTW